MITPKRRPKGAPWPIPSKEFAPISSLSVQPLKTRLRNGRQYVFLEVAGSSIGLKRHQLEDMTIVYLLRIQGEGDMHIDAPEDAIKVYKAARVNAALGLPQFDANDRFIWPTKQDWGRFSQWMLPAYHPNKRKADRTEGNLQSDMDRLDAEWREKHAAPEEDPDEDLPPEPKPNPKNDPNFKTALHDVIAALEGDTEQTK